MCGIAGYFGVDLGIAMHAVERMNQAQRHRGPDDEGVKALQVGDRHLVLGHRRLSILDPTPAGHQPMLNSATGDWIVYNGEIYNYPELRAQLEAAGHTFATRCDTEVILKAYEQWGVDCFGHLRGMFALALYDSSSHSLVLARDPLGIKPLYFHCDGKTLAFASEVRALRASGVVPNRVNRRALASLLAYGAVQAPDTIFDRVTILDPATLAISDLHADEICLKKTTFWKFPEPTYTGTREDAVAEIRRLLTKSVQSHLLSDVPVAVFLSRGMDSATIAALAARSSEKPIDTFTVAVREIPQMDESADAAEIAAKLSVRHHTILHSGEEVRGLVASFLNAADQPTVDGLNTYIVSKSVREQEFKVALSGLGGDEVFGGYNTFSEIPNLLRWAPLINLIPATARRVGAALLFSGKSETQRLKATEMAQKPVRLENLYFQRRRLFSDTELASSGFDSGLLGLNDQFVPPESHPEVLLAPNSQESSIGNLESRFYMGNMLLRDADAFGMAHGLELRVPMLDTELVAFLASMPGSWRVAKGGRNKPLLADAMEGVLPADLSRNRKQGFSLPMAHWMSGPMRSQFEALVNATTSVGPLSAEFVRATWDNFLAHPFANTSSRVWLLAVLGSYLIRESQADRFTR